MYVDARHENSTRRFMSATSCYLEPTRFVVIRLRGTSPTQVAHQIQTIRVFGWNSDGKRFPLTGFLATSVAKNLKGLPGAIFSAVDVEPEVYPQTMGTACLPPVEAKNQARISTPSNPAFFIGSTYYPRYFNEAEQRWRPVYRDVPLASWRILYQEENQQEGSDESDSGAEDEAAIGSEVPSSGVSAGGDINYIENIFYENLTVYESSHPYYRPNYHPVAGVARYLPGSGSSAKAHSSSPSGAHSFASLGRARPSSTRASSVSHSASTPTPTSHSTPSQTAPSHSSTAQSHATPSHSSAAPSHATPSHSSPAPSHSSPAPSHSTPSHSTPSHSYSAPSHSTPTHSSSSSSSSHSSGFGSSHPASSASS